MATATMPTADPPPQPPAPREPAPSKSISSASPPRTPPARTEKFSISYRPGMNITSVLGEIAADPITSDGAETTAIAYDANCLEEICGSCAMLINGKARMGLFRAGR